jgi:uncharacterized membrane protein
MATVTELNSPKSAYHVHWHILIIHFPISFYVVAFSFQILHLFSRPECFEASTNVALIGGTIVMIPTTLTGWRTWKTRYHGAHVLIFQRKIIIAFILLGLSILLTVWRVALYDTFENSHASVMHWTYLFGNSLLMLGAAAEGYYGGRLNHR